MSTRTLLEIGDDLQALNDLLEEAGNELATPEVEAAFNALADGISREEAVKLDGCVNYLRRLEMEATAARAEAEQYMMHATTREARMRRFKDFLLAYLQRSGRTKAETSTGRVLAIQKNGGKPPLRFVDNIDPATVPDHLVIVKRTLDTEAIRKALADADPEAKRIAMLDAPGCHLRIR